MNEYKRSQQKINEILKMKGWNANQIDLIIDGDFNTTLYIEEKQEPKLRQSIENYKRDIMIN